MPSPIDLQYAATLEPKLAVDYFRSKGLNINFDWRSAAKSAHSRAFSVANITRTDLLQTIYNEVDSALSTGTTVEQFIKNLKPVLKQAGWWGRQVETDRDGNIRDVYEPAHRLKTIYKTNLATSYQAARYQQQLAVTDTHPYWQYIAVVDANTRTEHAALHLKIFRHDDPIWQQFYPPNGWGCRCRVRILTEKQVKSQGLRVESSAGKLSLQTVDAGVDNKTGEVYKTEVSQFKSGSSVVKTGWGWSGNVGSAAMGSDISIAQKLVELNDRQLRQQVIESLNNAPARQSAFANWIGSTLTTNKPLQSVQPLGFITDSVAGQIEQRTGISPARLLTVTEKTVLQSGQLGSKTGLTFSELQNLPKLIANPELVLWDAEKQNLLFVASGSNNTKTVVTAPYKNRTRADELDVAVTTTRVSSGELDKLISDGIYTVLRGN